MLIDRIIYARLVADTRLSNLVGGRIVPTTPTVNSNLPHLTYSTVDTQTTSNNDGASSLETHTVNIIANALTVNEVDEILSQVKNTLHGYRAGQVRFAKLVSYADLAIENGSSAQQTYSVIQDSEVLSRIINITRNSDKVITLRNLTSSLTGLPVDDATVTAIVENLEDDTVYSFSLPFVSTGGYQGTLPAATTATFSDSQYTLTVTAVAPEGTVTLRADIVMLN